MMRLEPLYNMSMQALAGPWAKAGQRWYREARVVMQRLAERHRKPVTLVAAAIASHSRNCRWLDAVKIADKWLRDGHGGLSAAQPFIEQVRDCGMPLELRSKTGQFWLALCCSDSAVVLDRHMLRLLEVPRLRTPSQYMPVADYLASVARLCRVWPVQLQATLWLHQIASSGRKMPAGTVSPLSAWEALQ